MMKKSHSLLLLPVLTLAMLAPLTAEAQRRQSVSDRVAALEQQANAPSPTLELLTQIDDLRSEVRGLRAQIEELQHQNNETARSARTQYLDVDTRLQRLEAASAPPPIVLEPGENSAGPVVTPPAASAPTRPQPATQDERQAYDAALAALKAGKYADSARMFSDFLEAFPAGPYAPNAAYWLGESYYVTENYQLASEEFRNLVRRWPNHDKAPGGLLKYGMSLQGLKQDAEARATFDAVIAHYPASDAARTAEQRLRATTTPRR